MKGMNMKTNTKHKLKSSPLHNILFICFSTLLSLVFVRIDMDITLIKMNEKKNTGCCNNKKRYVYIQAYTTTTSTIVIVIIENK